MLPSSCRALEAALIIAAFLIQRDERRALRLMWGAGVMRRHPLNPRATGTGAVLGVLVATALGYRHLQGRRPHQALAVLPRHGVILVLVAGGLLASAAHAAAEAGLLTIGQAHAFDLTWLIAPGTIRASLITGVLGLQRTPTVIEVSLWVVYAIAISLYVSWPHGRARQKARAPNVEPSPATV